MKAVNLILLLLFMYEFSSKAQDNFILKEKELINTGCYGEALNLLLKYNPKTENEENRYRLYYKIAECNYYLQNYDMEAEYRMKLYLLDKEDKEILLEVAAAHQRAGNFDEAIKLYKLYHRKGIDPDAGRKGIASCEFAINQKNNPSNINVKVVPELSSKFYDYSTSFMNNEKNEIILTSSRLHADGCMESGLFYSKMSNSKWTIPIAFDNSVTKSGDIGVASIDNNRAVIFFTKCFKYDSINYSCDIFSTFMNGDLKGEVIKLNLKSADSIRVGHPSFSNKINTLFFAANLPGSLGGKDIWYVKYDNKTDSWSAPINAGPDINTVNDEVFPFINDDNTLYFSSNGHMGMGGLDIFKCAMTSLHKWGKPENLKYPVNSEADDFSIVFQDAHHGLFSSNRKGGLGKDDIYSFGLNESQFKANELKVQNENSFKELSKIFSKNEELSCPGNSTKIALNIYPNPNSGSFSVSITARQSENYFLRIFNNLGTIVLTKEFEMNSNQMVIPINLSLQSTGVYYVQLLNNNKVIVCDKVLVN
jgi:peptidoglycan-associated lipoprotein